MDTIWLVQGSAGSYDDYREWIVCAYRDKLLAEHHVKLANEKAFAFPKFWEKRESQIGATVWKFDAYKEFMGDLDPNAGWTGQTEYACFAVNINPGVPLYAALDAQCETFNCKLERGHADSCATNGD